MGKGPGLASLGGGIEIDREPGAHAVDVDLELPVTGIVDDGDLLVGPCGDLA